MILFKITFYLLIFFLIFHILTKKYINPYKFIMVFGKKGSGKTTFLVRTAQRYLRQGVKVYSTIPIAGTIYIKPSYIGYMKFDFGSVVLIDEVSLIWSNRDWKSMDKNVIAFFRYQRHYGLTVYAFSQSFDIDKKLRDLTDQMYLLKHFARVWSVCRQIDKRVTVSRPKDDEDGDKNGALVEDYSFTPVIFPGALKFIFIPRWKMFYDSFSEDLLLKDGNLQPIPYTGELLKARGKMSYVSYLVESLILRIKMAISKKESA